MTFPDCRTDEYYNEKRLNKEDSDIIKGYDIAVDEISCLFSNLDVYTEDFNIEGEDINLARFLENHTKIAERFEEVVADWFEKYRDELITAMIDEME